MALCLIMSSEGHEFGDPPPIGPSFPLCDITFISSKKVSRNIYIYK